jgi:uncharacterized membrane protein (DUF485 family)
MDCSGHGQTLATLRLRPGYWRTTPRSRTILDCPNSYCKGGSGGLNLTAAGGALVGPAGGDWLDYCTVGRTGPYCSVCAEGYERSASGGCLRCSDRTGIASPATVGAIMVVMMVLAAVAYLRRLRDDEVDEDLREKLEKADTISGMAGYAMSVASAMTKFKLVVVHYQMTSTLPTLISVRLPASVERFLSGMNIINLDLADIVRLGCFMKRTFYVDLIFFAVAPMGMALLGVALWAVYIVAVQHGRGLTDEVKAKRRGAAWDVLVTYVVGLSYFVYGFVSTRIFQIFACERFDDGQVLLLSDYRYEQSPMRYLHTCRPDRGHVDVTPGLTTGGVVPAPTGSRVRLRSMGRIAGPGLFLSLCTLWGFRWPIWDCSQGIER